MLQYSNANNNTVNPRTAGQILYAANIVRQYQSDLSTYPVSTLTIGGEKDGVLQITRMAEAYYFIENGNYSAKFPLVILPGVSHAQFSSGPPPQKVLEEDLKPEVTDAEAHRMIANVTIDYMRSVLENQPALLSGYENYTNEILNPLVLSMEMEGSYLLQKPCDSDTPSPHCPFYPAYPSQGYRPPSTDNACTCGSPWVEGFAMEIMAGNYSNVSSYVVDAFHDVKKDFKPMHNPHLWNKCTEQQVQADACVMNITTVTQLYYDRYVVVRE